MGRVVTCLVDSSIKGKVESVELCSPYGVIIKFFNGEVWKFSRTQLAEEIDKNVREI
jgi:hypothetical protein